MQWHDNRQFNDVATSATVKTAYPAPAPYFTLGNGWRHTIKPNFLFLWRCLPPFLLNLISWAPFATQTLTLNTPLSCKKIRFKAATASFNPSFNQRKPLSKTFLSHFCISQGLCSHFILSENSWQRISIRCLGFGEGIKTTSYQKREPNTPLVAN